MKILRLNFRKANSNHDPRTGRFTEKPGGSSEPKEDDKPSGAKDTLRAFGHMISQHLDSSGGYVERYGFVGEHGAEYSGVEAGVPAMQQKMCYNNSITRCMQDGTDYMEGYVFVHGMPLSHAWISDNGKQKDFTIRDPERWQYVGLRIPSDVLIPVATSKHFAQADGGIIGALNLFPQKKREAFLKLIVEANKSKGAKAYNKDEARDSRGRWAVSGGGRSVSTVGKAFADCTTGVDWPARNQERYNSDPEFRAACDAVTTFTQGGFVQIRNAACYLVTGEPRYSQRYPAVTFKPEHLDRQLSMRGRRYFDGQDSEWDEDSGYEESPDTPTVGEGTEALMRAVASSPLTAGPIYRAVCSYRQEDRLTEMHSLDVGDKIKIPAPTSFTTNHELPEQWISGEADGSPGGGGASVAAILKVLPGARAMHVSGLSPYKHQKEMLSQGEFEVVEREEVSIRNIFIQENIPTVILTVRHVGVYVPEPRTKAVEPIRWAGKVDQLTAFLLDTQFLKIESEPKAKGKADAKKFNENEARDALGRWTASGSDPNKGMNGNFELKKMFIKEKNPSALKARVVKSLAKAMGQPHEVVQNITLADLCLKGWASSSTRHSRSTALQLAAAKHLAIQQGSALAHLEDQMRESVDEFGADRWEALAITAASLLQALIKTNKKVMDKIPESHIMLYRGVTIRHQIGDEPLKEGKEVTFMDNPLASWSSSLSVATEFAESTSGLVEKVVIARAVPKEEILCTALTGVGCLDEEEAVVVCDKPVTAKIVTVIPADPFDPNDPKI